MSDNNSIPRTEALNRRFIPTAEAANYLCISPRTLEPLRNCGMGPPYAKLGRLCRYTVDDLDEWARAHRRPAPPHVAITPDVPQAPARNSS